MPDVFISYKQEERAFAARLATRLTEAGYDVWWDAALLAGERFEDEISAVLSASRAVIILWSRKAIDSDWVKAEAESARQQKKALPTVIDDLPPDRLPLLFRGLHVAPLKDWDGNETHPGFAELMKSLTDRLGAARGPALSASEAEAKLAEGVSEAEIWAAISAAPDPSADEYRAYLKRFGASARFAELARIRIARIEKKEHAESPRSGRRVNPLWLVLAALVVIVGGGAFLLFREPTLLNAVGNMFVPQDVKDAAARCTAWSTSPKLAWETGIPALDATAAADCAKASDGFPKSGDYLGMLAMARIAQGSMHADEAISLANRGVALNAASANFAMAAMYQHGVNLPIDANRAATYYKAAADLGMIRAAAELCLISIDLGIPPINIPIPDMTAYCDRASDAGDALGLVAQGYLLETGLSNHTVDYAGAAALYRKAADQGSPEGELALGGLYQLGLGLDRDWARALSLYGAAADAGYPEALRRLAIMYELGQGAPADLNHASQLYETASIKGDLVALFLAGYGVDPKIVATNRLVREIERIANDPSNSVGQRMLGQLFDRGYLRTVDVSHAVAEYTLCADAGNAMCQVSLGYDETAHLGNNERALQLFQQSADQGNLYGQYWLGYMYEYGLGVTADIQQAAANYRLAAAQGHLTSINRINQLKAAGTIPP